MPQTRHRLWLVDDVALERDASGAQLGTDFDVELFEDGATVLERALNSPLPDLLVLDWHMEGLEGLDVLRFLRSQPTTVGLPVLVFTATGSRDDLLDALTAGADDYVGKGSPVEEVKARVNTLIRASRLRGRAERAEAELEELLVRERNARAEAEAANLEKDHFLAMISHELRTPLSAILGWARMLKGGGLDAAQIARGIETIERNAVDQARLVDDLFDVARIVSGSLRLELAPVDLSSAVENAIDAHRPVATLKRLRLSVDLCPALVSGDIPRLQQVASNLLSNAVKFTPAGGAVTITVKADERSVTLTVSDTGPGIAPALLPRVFDRFRQGDPSITRHHGGLGLGLAIVRQIVQMHGGTVEAKNLERGGAAFEVLLPVLSHQSPTEARSYAGPSAIGARVLVTGADADARASLVGVLGASGAAVTEATSTDDAMAALLREPPDVVVFSVAIAAREGQALLSRMRRRSARALPAIVVGSMHGHEDFANTAVAAGFQFHFQKPVDTDALLRAIWALTEGRRLT